MQIEKMEQKAKELQAENKNLEVCDFKFYYVIIAAVVCYHYISGIYCGFNSIFVVCAAVWLHLFLPKKYIYSPQRLESR